MPIELPLNTMSVEEKVQLLEHVWDNLCRQSGDVRSPEWHAEILNDDKDKLKMERWRFRPGLRPRKDCRSLGNEN